MACRKRRAQAISDQLFAVLLDHSFLVDRKGRNPESVKNPFQVNNQFRPALRKTLLDVADTYLSLRGARAECFAMALLGRGGAQDDQGNSLPLPVLANFKNSSSDLDRKAGMAMVISAFRQSAFADVAGVRLS